MFVFSVCFIKKQNNDIYLQLLSIHYRSKVSFDSYPFLQVFEASTLVEQHVLVIHLIGVGNIYFQFNYVLNFISNFHFFMFTIPFISLSFSAFPLFASWTLHAL